MCCCCGFNAVDKTFCAIRQHKSSSKSNSWICKIQAIRGHTENETVCCSEHWNSNPFCTTVCLITELIYLIHYLISSPSHTGPDENSDYRLSMGQGGELNFYCSELGKKRGIVQKMQGDSEMCSSRVVRFLHKLTLGSVSNIIFVFTDQFLNHIWLSTHASPLLQQTPAQSRNTIRLLHRLDCTRLLLCFLFTAQTHIHKHTLVNDPFHLLSLRDCCNWISLSWFFIYAHKNFNIEQYMKYQ